MTTTLSMAASEGELLEISGNLNIGLFDFFQASGGFALEKSTATVKVNGVDQNVDLLTLGASGVSAFVGLEGGTSSALGLELSGVDLALALMNDKVDTSRKWAALKGNADSASFIGVDGVTIASGGLSVTINRAAVDGSVVDFASMTGGGLEIAVGPSETLLLDMADSAGVLTRASGNLTLGLGGSVGSELCRLYLG